MNFMMTPLRKMGNGIRAFQAHRNRKVAFKALGRLDAQGLQARIQNGQNGSQFIDVNSRVLFGGNEGGFLGVRGKKTYRIVGKNLADPATAIFDDLQVIRNNTSPLKIMERDRTTGGMNYMSKPNVDNVQNVLFTRQPQTSDHLTTALRQPLRTAVARNVGSQNVTNPVPDLTQTEES